MITGVTVMFCTEEKVEGEIFGETNKKRPKMVVEIFYWVLANGVFSSPINSSTLIIFHPNGSDSNEKEIFFKITIFLNTISLTVATKKI